jgi:hypothetical protein
MNTTTETSVSSSAARAIVKDAQAKQIAHINETRKTFLQGLIDLEDIGGRENVKQSLLAVILEFQDGIRNVSLKQAFDEAEFASAIKALKNDGLIEQVGKRGDDVIYKPTSEALSETKEKKAHSEMAVATQSNEATGNSRTGLTQAAPDRMLAQREA